MEDKVVAILAKKIKTNNGVYFLQPISTVRDGMLDENDILTTLDGKNYYSCHDVSFYNDKKQTLCYMYPLFQSDLQMTYQHEIFSENILEYVNDIKKNIYFATITDSNEVNIAMMNQEKLKDVDSDLFIKRMVCRISQGPDITLQIPKSLIDQLYSYLDNNDIESAKKIISLLQQVCVKVEEKRSEKQEVKEVSKEPDTEKIITVKDVYNMMKSEIVGQDETIKKVLSSLDIDEYASDASQKRRLLIVGSTGCGKTQIMRSLSNILARPLVIVDTTQITMSGYVGGTIEENILRPLIERAGGDIVLAQSGIVDLDEIDKKGSSDNYDVSGRGVLNALLPFLDGTVYNVKYDKITYEFDTSNLSVFATGAFTSVFNSIKDEKTLGFGKEKRDYKNLTIEDIINIGNIPNEFMGRFSNVSIMNNLTVSDYEKILTESKISDLLFVKNYLLDCYNVDLKYTDSYITEIAKKAIELKLGGRALKRIIDTSISVARWEIITSDSSYKELILDKEAVNDPKKYILR